MFLDMSVCEGVSVKEVKWIFLEWVGTADSSNWLIFTGIIYPLLKVEYCSPLWLLFCYVFLPLVLLFALHISVFQHWVHIYLQLFYLLDKFTLLSLYDDDFVCCDNFLLKLYFVWSKYSYLCFLLVTIFMEYLLPSFPFQHMCVLLKGKIHFL